MYLVIAITLTALQLYIEYQSTRDRITLSLLNIEEVVYKNLAITLWNYNIEAVTSIISGLEKNDFLEGALITMATGEKMGFGSVLKEERGENVIYQISNDNDLIKKELSFFDVNYFGHDFPIFYTRDDGVKELVGHMFVFSSHARVVDSVKSTFVIIVISAIIKTLALWFIFVWAIKTKLSKPLNAFAQFMAKLDVESTSYQPVNINSADRNELKLIEETFNEMQKKIVSYKQSIKEKELALQDINSNLSIIVEQRTEELDAANDDLMSQNYHLKKTLDELEETQKKLAFTAHKAGMAEVSSGVLHTLGTTLNSVNIHNSSIKIIIEKSKLDSLMRVNNEFGVEFSEFRKNIKGTDKEEQILELYHAAGPRLEGEKKLLLELVNDLNERIHLMMSNLNAQRKYAEYGQFIENVSIKDLIDDSLMMTVHSEDEIELIIKGDESLVIKTEKNKFFNILVNLIINARESVMDDEDNLSKIMIMYAHESNYFYISIVDNGNGIDESDLTKIFNFGYSTRENHDGFGLHNSANQAMEIGGVLTVKSDSVKRETTFTLKLPSDN